jgi:hypothetical protein
LETLAAASETKVGETQTEKVPSSTASVQSAITSEFVASGFSKV